jgi:putative DNA methylase
VAAQEIITRRNLPHWYVPGAMHFVTYRLAGTLPQEVLHELRERRRMRLEQPVPEGRSTVQHRERAQKLFFADYDRYLDQHRAVDWLARPAVAALIRGNLYHHAGSKYHLLAYCVMPNHVHVLFQPLEAPARPAQGDEALEDEQEDAKGPLASIMHSLKSYTAHRANELLARTGQFWQHESYDHWVRDQDELERIVQYIVHNPVAAKLVQQPHEWFFSSAHDRFLQDGSTDGFLLAPLMPL